MIDADISHTIAKLAKLAIVLVVLYGAAHRLRFNYTTPAIILLLSVGQGLLLWILRRRLNTPNEIQHDTDIRIDSDSDGISDGMRSIHSI